jgi:hypothetical protein
MNDKEGDCSGCAERPSSGGRIKDLRLISDVGELVGDSGAARDEDFPIGKQCRVPPDAIIIQIGDVGHHGQEAGNINDLSPLAGAS